MPGDSNAMDDLLIEMKEEAKEELEQQQADPDEEKEEETDPAAEETKEEEEADPAIELEAEENKDPKAKKTPEDYKKLRLALKEKDKAEKQLREDLDKERLEKAELKGYKEAHTKPKEEEKKEIEDPEPDQEFDALNWLKWNARQQNKKIDAAAEQTKKVAISTQATQEQAAIVKLDNEFKAKQPDYEDAVNFVLDMEKKAIKARFPNATDKQIDDHLIGEKVKLYREEYNAGRVPGETVMRMANAYGYAGKKKAANNPEGKNGHKPNLGAIKKNMEKSASLTGSSAAPTGEVDPESLFDMSLAKLARMPKGNWDKAMKTAREIDGDEF